MITRAEFAGETPEPEPSRPPTSIPCPWPYGCDQRADLEADTEAYPAVYECPEHGRIHDVGGDAA